MILQPVFFLRTKGVSYTPSYTPQEEALPAPPFNMEDHGPYGPERGNDDKKMNIQPKELQLHTRSFAQRLHSEKKTMLPAWVGGGGGA